MASETRVFLYLVGSGDHKSKPGRSLDGRRYPQTWSLRQMGRYCKLRWVHHQTSSTLGSAAHQFSPRVDAVNLGFRCSNKVIRARLLSLRISLLCHASITMSSEPAVPTNLQASLIIASVSGVTLLTNLLSGALTISLPSIGKDLSISDDSLQWPVSMYS